MLMHREIYTKFQKISHEYSIQRYSKQKTSHNHVTQEINNGFNCNGNMTAIGVFRTLPQIYTTNIYLLTVNNRNTRKSCKRCSKFTIKTPEKRH